jgi:hypothetical protein
MASLHQGKSRERKHCNVLPSIGKEAHPRLPQLSAWGSDFDWIGRLLLTPSHTTFATQPSLTVCSQRHSYRPQVLLALLLGVET